MNTERNELAEYFGQLVRRTREGQIAWSQISPTTYASVRDTPSGPKRMTLTRAQRSVALPRIHEGKPVRDADLLFQVETLRGLKHVELSIDTKDKPDLYDIFEALFEAARSSVEVQSVRILRELVG